MKNIKNYEFEELKQELKNIGERPFRAEQIYKWLYEEKVKSFDEMTNLSKELREKLNCEYSICNFNILRKQESKDGTIKYLFDVLDGNAIETVLMKYHHGYSLCVSSQIGCKMGCKFCASTGIQFIRSLSAGEIVEQVLAVEQDQNIRISNIVFMGIGEPLDNYDNVVKAIRIINHPKGLNIGARHISISTSGLVPKIYKLAEENIQCTLSISLHATNNEKRSSMMPVNDAYPIEELIKACKDYIKITNRRISFEYALAKDNNDNLEDAKELVKLLKGMLCHVNLIPINKIENGKFDKSSNENIMKFRDYLNDHGIVATIRRELGSDIDAACRTIKKKKFKRRTIMLLDDIKEILPFMKKIKVYAFVGPSGTGKSYRAQMVASEKDIHFIIDDGLLIKDNEVIAGESAKKAETKVATVKHALFYEDNEKEVIIKALKKYKPNSILILGTSDGMVKKIAENLSLPEISETIYITDVATEQEMQTARRIRVTEGKHVIPVPTFEIKKDFSGYLLDPLQIFKSKGKGQKPYISEKSIIRPTFSYMGKFTISDLVFRQILEYLATQTKAIHKILKTRVENYGEGVNLYMEVSIVYGYNVIDGLKSFKEKARKEIEKLTAMNVVELEVVAKNIYIPQEDSKEDK